MFSLDNSFSVHSLWTFQTHMKWRVCLHQTCKIYGSWERFCPVCWVIGYWVAWPATEWGAFGSKFGSLPQPPLNLTVPSDPRCCQTPSPDPLLPLDSHLCQIPPCVTSGLATTATGSLATSGPTTTLVGTLVPWDGSALHWIPWSRSSRRPQVGLTPLAYADPLQNKLS